MTTIYSARWVLPVSAPPIEHGAVAVEGQRIAGVGPRAEIVERFPESNSSLSAKRSSCRVLSILTLISNSLRCAVISKTRNLISLPGCES